jgi:cobalt-zinc-cadmium resistance protein CzcA
MIRKALFKTACIVSWLLPLAGIAQQKITLQEAVQTALKNNPLIHANEYQVAYYKEAKKSATDIGKLNATWMHGQYNSLYQDNNVTLTQTIPFPTTLSNQVKLGKEQVIGAQTNLVVVQNEMAFEVKSAYYQLLYQQALKSLLLSQDSLLNDFSKASALRYKTGESNLLAKTTAETQWLEAQNLVMQNNADINISQTKLQTLLKSEAPVEASESLSKRIVPEEIDSASLQSNPQLKSLRQQVAISAQNRRVERSRILPDLSVGYFAQSLTGVQNINGQDQYFPHSKVFQGFDVGLAIPLWIRPHLARARAASFQEEAARKNAEYFKTTLSGNFAQALREVDKNIASITYYENSALKNADLILNQAGKAYKAGEIGYLEYLQALKNAIAIKTNYLSFLNQYNQSVIRLEFLLGKIN